MANERLSVSGEQESTGDSANHWDMSDAPAFDPEAAQRRSEEDKPNDFEVEDLKNLDKLQNQLEQMGARAEIVHNPAFKRELDDLAYRFRGARTISSEGVQSDSLKNRLHVDCDLITPYDKRDTQRHGNFIFTVSPNGSLTIGSGKAERTNSQRIYESSAFQDYDGGLIDDQGNISVIDKENISQVATFEMSKDGQDMLVNKSYISEYNIKPVEHRGKYNQMVSHIFHSETTQSYDRDGVEQWKTYIQYEPYNRKISDAGQDWYGKLEYAQIVTQVPTHLPRVVEQREEYHRTSPTTMDCQYYEKGFSRVDLKDIRIHGEHEDELVSNDVGRAISEALAEQRAAKQQN